MTAVPALLGLILGTSQILQSALSKLNKSNPFINFLSLWVTALLLALGIPLIPYPYNVTLAVVISTLCVVFLVWARHPEKKFTKKEANGKKGTDAKLARDFSRYLWL